MTFANLKSNWMTDEHKMISEMTANLLILSGRQNLINGENNVKWIAILGMKLVN